MSHELSTTRLLYAGCALQRAAAACISSRGSKRTSLPATMYPSPSAAASGSPDDDNDESDSDGDCDCDGDDGGDNDGDDGGGCDGAAARRRFAQASRARALSKPTYTTRH